MTCEVCRPWTAATWEQHETRLRDLRALAKPPARCPRCNGTDWATAPPPIAKPRPEQGLSASALVALALAAAMATVLLVLFGRLAL